MLESISVNIYCKIVVLLKNVFTNKNVCNFSEEKES